jgi:hypothetical protein
MPFGRSVSAMVDACEPGDMFKAMLLKANIPEGGAGHGAMGRGSPTRGSEHLAVRSVERIFERALFDMDAD